VDPVQRLTATTTVQAVEGIPLTELQNHTHASHLVLQAKHPAEGTAMTKKIVLLA
jgi:hypothetical protein